MKNLLATIWIIGLLNGACTKPQIGQTRIIGEQAPWSDSSIKHVKNAAFKALLEKYKSKGLPGISLLVNDQHGTWIGAAGKADIVNNIDFVPGTISKAASITRFLN
jgi:D-alanyl-D-alanine carboxypeptidase